MTADQQRIAIAEFCGVKPLAENEGVRRTWIETFDEDLGPWGFIKKYDQNLNAMREAESRLSEDQCRDYNRRLSEIAGRPNILKFPILASAYLFHATAAQRAEALLKTIGKWIEG